MNTLSIIGSGKMAEALLKGILNKNIFSSQNIIMTDVSAQRLEYLAQTYQVRTNSNNILAFQSDIIILAVKPQNFAAVLDELNSSVEPGKLIVSIIAGVPVKKIDPKNALKVIRTMPNTPALVGAGATALFFNSRVSDQEKAVINKIFSAVGETVEVPEEYLNAVTALSGSGPAFVFRFIEAFITAGIEAGLPPETARKLTLQTFQGSVELLKKSDKSIAELIEQVTSPNGTTAAGRKVLEDSDYKQIILNTLMAAKKRAEELGK